MTAVDQFNIWNIEINQYWIKTSYSIHKDIDLFHLFENNKYHRKIFITKLGYDSTVGSYSLFR